ncbi:carboxylesterase/lipase family protein [Pendulispora albinea]|uniref:Carboxylic ester hydrolase n=1 Tax=Pendulispora albinea TaxID=2741071 RepID=A0ABZ2MAQ1_9BACT
MNRTSPPIGSKTKRPLGLCLASSLVSAFALFVACDDDAPVVRPDPAPKDAATTDVQPAPDAATSSDVTVATDTGPIIGTESNGVRTFLGIPYAAPPVNARRWKAPEAIRWSEPRPAKSYGPRCFGVSLLDSSAVRSGASEDCLSLNIWSPAGASAKPVLLWIHGGASIDGTSGDGPGGGYPGATLASTGDVVVVSINFRLGALGVLAIPSADGGGNLALLDQQLALRWVQRNIAAFGGDPAKVTIAGNSSGAQAVCLHGTMPSSQGLFRGLLAQSGNCDGVQTRAQAAATATRLAGAWGCTGSRGAGTEDGGAALDEACLRALPAETIVRGNTSNAFSSIVDGTLVPVSPRAALAAGTFAKVPILTGFNANEGLFFTDGVFGALPLVSPSDYTTALQLVFGPLAPVLEGEYPLAQYGGDPRTALAALIGDGTFECGTRHLAASSSSPVFAYRFDHAPQLATSKPVLAMHTVELPFVWGAPLPWTWWQQTSAGVPSTPPELELARRVKNYWTSFVRTQNPAAAGAPEWPAWSASSPRTMVLSDSARLTELPANAHCAFWDRLNGGT